ncbi:MAG: hypothetical protein F4Y21_09195 [Gemmatimonadetes bacterium]|nr:hypothetical protein [Gemmatimonadota bacterium]
MSSHTPRPVFLLPAMILLLAGCDPVFSPNLTGEYILESAQSAEWTGGTTLTPPAATGVLLMTQSAFGPDLTHGYVKVELTHSPEPVVLWSGRYTTTAGGIITLRFDSVRFEGEYELDDNTLTTMLTGDEAVSEPSPAGTLVWKREPESS